ncbi:hypothetical protein LJ739_09075 [Aestuariibacter halophilus]|uniref:Uncharacterized protein n=1 Tax=Fluctibacter halophilus TaxID=226011 RepID=A0ABS8G760_9ALTE|nr:hypothetical protein [Aestuariibacter halophilus]MCC2616390.1 hypothetical protein [Aestuariibacter halophilus]
MKKMKLGLQVGRFIAVWGLFQLCYSISANNAFEQKIEQTIGAVETRIALDLPRLKLANPRLRTVTHEASIVQYIEQVNAQLANKQSPVTLRSIQGIPPRGELTGTARVVNLATGDQNIRLLLEVAPQTLAEQFSYTALLATLLLQSLWSRQSLRRQRHKSKTQDTTVANDSKLIINLHDKTLSYGKTSQPVLMSNKPFCFYAALVEYCSLHPDAYLKHNSDVPEDLIQLANRYFSRLIALGHTKRKRPDFATNLDKTLSEVRSALDDVFRDQADAKDPFYPPKAQGEGSRSKMHNYALLHLEPGRIEVLGR